MKTLKVIIVAGARPNFMKVAPLIREIDEHNQAEDTSAVQIDWRLVHTGQHYDDNMSDVFFRELGIPRPHFNLGVGSGSHAVQTASIMTGFEAVCEYEKPNWIIVVGDVNSTLACSLVCSKLGIRVAHVEAGLRSYDRTMPEEINRIVTDALSDLLLTPSEDASDNLRREGVAEERIQFVGNIMIDSLVENLPTARQNPILERHRLERAGFAYVTLHRPSNVDDRSGLAAIMHELGLLSHQMPVVFPIHPRTRKMLADSGAAPDQRNDLLLLDPIGYHESLSLTENARLVITDSGGLQEESTFFRTPCLTLRPNTERPVTLTIGSNRLTSIPQLAADIDQAMNGSNRIGQLPPLWDGHTAQRIIRHLLRAATGKTQVP